MIAQEVANIKDWLQKIEVKLDKIIENFIAADEAKTAVEKIAAVNSYDFSGGWPE